MSYMVCRKCFREVWGDISSHAQTCKSRVARRHQSFSTREAQDYVRLHNVLDDTNPDTVAGDLLQHIDHDLAEERAARREEFSDDWPL